MLCRGLVVGIEDRLSQIKRPVHSRINGGWPQADILTVLNGVVADFSGKTKRQVPGRTVDRSAM